VLFLLVPLLSFPNTHASYRIGSDPISLENTSSFDEDSFSFSLDHGKHLASPLSRISLYNICIMSMIVHLSIGV
jgi:hypothetical protein